MKKKKNDSIENIERAEEILVELNQELNKYDYDDYPVKLFNSVIEDMEKLQFSKENEEFYKSRVEILFSQHFEEFEI